MREMLPTYPDQFPLQSDRSALARNLGSVARASWALEEETLFYLSDRRNRADGWVSVLQALGFTVLQSVADAEELCAGPIVCDFDYWQRNTAVLQALKRDCPAAEVIVLTGIQALPAHNGHEVSVVFEDFGSALTSAGIGFFVVQGGAKC
jgi:hypothetical protein